MTPDPKRCAWPGDDPILVAYHDREWGVPIRRDRKIFEFLVLESAQAGLSWITVLRKRKNYRAAFAGFDPERVARFTPQKIERTLQDPGIIRNRAKIEATVNNAKRFLDVQREFRSFSKYMWRFVQGAPVDGRRRRLRDIPATTPEAHAFAQDLKTRGFKFLGPTVVYAHMQAAGMVNDHTKDCFRYKELQPSRLPHE